MEGVLKTVKANVDKLDNYLTTATDPASQHAVKLAAKVHQRPAHVVLGFVGLLLLLLFSQNATVLLTAVVGVAYPILRSIQALEDKTDSDWLLIYWIIFGALSVLEVFREALLNWFPFFYLFKLALLVWCQWPGEANGSLFIHRQILRPIIARRQSARAPAGEKSD
eukprot:m.34817 g.34817  ORF g.34817 m.34817 type:complete len:166 (+) comp11204_c0_seq2:47-544(+)